MRIANLLFALLPLLLWECGNTIQDLPGEGTVKSISFTLSSFGDPENQFKTKTSLADDGSILWAEHDTVGIYPNTRGQVYFSIEGESGSNYARFDGGGWAFKPSSTYYSYYPFIGKIYLNRNRIPVSYLGQKQIGITSTAHIGHYDFMYTSGTQVESESINFNYSHLNCVIGFILRLPAGTYTNLTITAPTEVFPIAGYYDLMSDHPVIIPTQYSDHLSIELEGVTVDDQQQFIVYLMSAPVNLNGVGVVVSVLNGEKTELRCNKTPSREYLAQMKYTLTCTSWTEVPQSMSMSIQGWDVDGNLNGTAQ